MKKELEKKLKENYAMYQNSNVAAIKQNVIFVLLEEYGYDLTKLKGENNVEEFIVEAGKLSYLRVHVVKPNTELSLEKQGELRAKLSLEQIEWGLLSNGKDYILMNHLITATSNLEFETKKMVRDEVVFQLNLFNELDLVYFDFFSKKSLFETRVTHYFKDIAQFKALKYPNGGRNWNVYKSTIVNFFLNYSLEKGKYVELNKITVEDFENFLRDEMTRKKSRNIISRSTLESKYSYIRSFFKTLEVKESEFFEKKSIMIERFSEAEDPKEYDDDLLSEHNIRKILAFYDGTRDSVRYKAIFLLCLAYGFERSTLMDLSFKQVKERVLFIDGRELMIPLKIWQYLQELKANNEEKGLDHYFFYSKYKGDYKRMSDNQFNYVFDILETQNSEWKKLNSAYIRFVLIKKLFNNNFPLEEIVYYTGADLSTISNLISMEEIIEKVKFREENAKKVHPFAVFLGKEN